MKDKKYDFLAGATLLVDKPLEWTSFDVVNKIRYALRKTLGVKKIKVGHAGTLDPLATGLLIICTGKSTKTIDGIQALYKEYTGTIKLGATTPSYDAETEEDSSFPTDGLTEEQLKANCAQFIGPIAQMPPIFSAIKVNGQPLYKKARKGEKVEVKARNITIHEFELTNIEMPKVDFRAKCSKGTYIRSLAHDFGKALGNGGYLSALCRTKIGEHSLEDAWNLPELIKHIEENYEPVPKN
ncbi:MAG: tRNA pseudouridine(55) synthase TruB [Aureispira sp.]|nr:tRNA pseudouridine(55) synthase TruB [Aureispira sp.]